MNTPCPECNFIHWRISCAFTKRDYADLQYWYIKRDEHQAVCFMNGNLYKLLWSNVEVSPTRAEGAR
jgi:hypothetical protein